jgi:hypothetical protein
MISSRGESFYEPMVFTSFFITFFVVVIALLILAALSRGKVEKTSPKALYFYVMSFVSLLFLADGLSIFITMIADLIVALGKINMDIKKAFLACCSLLVVAAPAYLFHWSRVRKGLGIEQEKELWPYYKYMVLGLSAISSLIFIGNLFYQVLSSILGISKFDWSLFNIILGYGIVGLVVWAYHWFFTGTEKD